MARKTETVLVRVTPAEKAGLTQAAELAGIPLSAWVRERVRLAAIRELEGVGRRVPFVASVPMEEDDG
jgi:hypothetical protein